MRTTSLRGRTRRKVVNSLRELLAFARYHQWHYGKMPLLIALLFILNLRFPDSLTLIATIKWYLIIALFLAFAYMLNNISDFEVDNQVGKVLVLRTWSMEAKWGVTLLVGIAGFLLGVVSLDAWALLTLGACYLLAWSYSFPPRFKESVWLGPIVASVGQLCAPALVILVAYRQATPTELCYLVLLFLWGFRMILVHQILDRANDIATGVRTTVLVIGLEKAYRLLWGFFLVEVAVLGLQIAFLLGSGLEFITLVFLLYELVNLFALKKRGGQLRLDTYDCIPLADIYEMILPLTLAVSLSIHSEGKLWWTVLVVILLFGLRYRERLTATYFSFVES